MKAFEINSCYQRHICICDTMAEAEAMYNKMYGYASAVRIEKISDYVMVKGIDDKEAK